MDGEPALAGHIRKILLGLPHAGMLLQWRWETTPRKVTLPCRHSAASHRNHLKINEVLPQSSVALGEGFGVAHRRYKVGKGKKLPFFTSGK